MPARGPWISCQPDRAARECGGHCRRRAFADPFGFPLRLRTAVKLGFKNAKWVTGIEVTNDFQETFWSKQGFNWFAGI